MNVAIILEIFAQLNLRLVYFGIRSIRRSSILIYLIAICVSRFSQIGDSFRKLNI